MVRTVGSPEAPGAPRMSIPQFLFELIVLVRTLQGLTLRNCLLVCNTATPLTLPRLQERIRVVRSD